MQKGPQNHLLRNGHPENDESIRASFSILPVQPCDSSSIEFVKLVELVELVLLIRIAFWPRVRVDVHVRVGSFVRADAAGPLILEDGMARVWEREW